MDRAYILVLVSSPLPYSKTRQVVVPLLFVGLFICLVSLLDKFLHILLILSNSEFDFCLFSIVKYCLLPFIDLLRSCKFSKFNAPSRLIPPDDMSCKFFGYFIIVFSYARMNIVTIALNFITVNDKYYVEVQHNDLKWN